MKNHLSKATLAAVGATIGLAAVRSLRSRYSFRDKTVAIMGGTRGLGLELARCFAAEGARLAICSRNPRDVASAEAILHESGASVFAEVCDVRDPAQVREFIVRVFEKWQAIDVLVNNAGVIQVGPVECATAADYHDAMDTHYWGPLHATLAVVNAMRRRRSGRIVNIASIGGKIAVPHLLPYSGSKFALVGLSEGLRAELARDGILVTTVCPGLMRTGSPRNAMFKGRHRAEYAWFSISDSLPGISMSSTRAARQIVEACRRGDAEAILSLPAKLAVRFHGLFPGLSMRLLEQVNRLLPTPGGIGTGSAQGRHSRSALSPSLLTVLDDRAAARNNQLRES